MGSCVRVLVVDDHKLTREWVRSKLCSTAHFEIVGEAGDGYDAVVKAQTLNPDLVLLDIAMPGLSGIETAILVRRVVPDTKILFLSMNNDPDVIRTVLNDSANGFVLKSNAESELLPAIQAVLRGETFNSLPLQKL